ncbi:WD-40 repeat protein [Reticulomyxa filosa]|uniref:WD-40 repeat protein n=1 Tax=Reticulomyxa filosa TaxID=46433 RepID=X6P0T3_RETFI|nr:WD-40 repeat protein [Reticulomyxa filosa]|eukprot:ETO31689.1 WD-40 repeat protein [Reticulomyxa filosa]
MLRLGPENNTETRDRELVPSLRHSCYNINWILQLNDSNKINDLICLICKQVANNPIEINCPQHASLDASLIVGEECLKQFFKSAPNSCPVQSHDNCECSKSKFAQLLISELEIMCPLQFQRDFQPHMQNIECSFEGKVKDLNNHLDNDCPLASVDCWFKPFGCDHSCLRYHLQEHLISNMKMHFDLVTKSFNVLKQTFLSLQKEVVSLQSQNKQLKFEMELKKKSNEDNLTTLKENSQKYFVYIKYIEKKKNKQRKIFAELKQLKDNKKGKQKADNNQILEKEIETEKKAEQESIQSLFCLFDSAKVIKTLNEHTEAVHSIDYSIFNQNRYICSGSCDKTIRIWDLETFKQMKKLDGHSDKVYSVKFSSYHYYNNKLPILCSASADKTIRFWDYQVNNQIRTLNGHTDSVRSIQFSSFNNGRYLCSGSWDNTVHLWDIETYSSLHVFQGHTHRVTHVEFSQLSSRSDNNKCNSFGVIGGNGYTICSGSYDNTIHIWDIEKCKKIVVLKGHKDVVRCVKYEPHGLRIDSRNTILSGSDDKTVRLWDIRDVKEVQILKGHTNYVTCVEYLPFENINTICSGSFDNTIRFWDIRINKQLYEIQGDDHDNGIYCFQFFSLQNKTKNKDILCYGSANGRIRMWG